MTQVKAPSEMPRTKILLRPGPRLVSATPEMKKLKEAFEDAISATKAAVRSFARTWTTDLKDRRIRVNAVSPGSTDTPGLNELLASSETGKEPGR